MSSPETTPTMLAGDPLPGTSRWATTLLWWVATLLTLMVLDDLTFGPVFWLISTLGSPTAGFVIALLVYVPAQISLVRHGTSETPGKVAAYLLGRLDLQRRSHQIAARERRMKSRVTGTLSALALSCVIGGVLPPLLLHRAGYGTAFVRRLSVATALIYAVEFALIHGLLPGTL